MKRITSINHIFWLGIICSSTTLADLDDRTISQSFMVKATITKGCLLGSGNADVGSFGTVTFGDISSLEQHHDVTSKIDGGSIQVKCNPGTAVSIGLSSGIHSEGAISSGRLLKHQTTNDTLKYQLFQDANYRTIWGDNSNGGSVKSITSTGSVETFPIYARLFATDQLPSSGLYTDIVTVVVTY